MFVYQNGKLYVQYGDKAVGVEIYTDGSINKVEGTECDIVPEARFLTPHEVRCQYNVGFGGTYEFPREIKEVEVVADGSDTTTKPKTRSRKKS